MNHDGNLERMLTKIMYTLWIYNYWLSQSGLIFWLIFFLKAAVTNGIELLYILTLSLCLLTPVKINCAFNWNIKRCIEWFQALFKMGHKNLLKLQCKSFTTELLTLNNLLTSAWWALDKTGKPNNQIMLSKD